MSRELLIRKSLGSGITNILETGREKELCSTTGGEPIESDTDNYDKKFVSNLIALDILTLQTGENYTLKDDIRECVFVLLSGICHLTLQGKETVFERKDVFTDIASGAYIPPREKLEIKAESPIEAALCWANVSIDDTPSQLQPKPIFISHEDIKVKKVGKDNFSRDVYDILTSDMKAYHLLVGETINPPGNWSSYPPHCHEIDNPPKEVKMEEVYYFKIKPNQGFALQRIYSDDASIDLAYVINDGDAMLLPFGYHPIVAAGGYQLYYLWILAGKIRELCPRDDPNHSWTKYSDESAKGLKSSCI